MIKKIVTLVILCGITNHLGAVSAFNAGDSSVDLSELQEKVEGISSLINGINARISKLENKVADLEIRVNSSKTASVGEQNEVQSIKKDIKNLKSDSDKLSRVASAKVDNFKEKKNNEIMSEADKLFSDKKYQSAKDRYSYLSSKKYQPAKSNYMLGEISYSNKEYANAINFYKKSISFKDSTSYTPKLLYHTAVSFSKIGDSKSADAFFKVLKEKYPDSKEAKSIKGKK